MISGKDLAEPPVVSPEGDSDGSGASVWFSMAAAGGLGLITGMGALAVWGAGSAGTEAALRLTARLAFLFFWLSYVGGALVTLAGKVFQPLKRRARPLGLAFGAVLTIHLGLVSWLSWIGHPPSLGTFAIFGFAAFWAFLLSASSIGRIGRAVGSTGWWILRNVGANFIAFAFALDFLRQRYPAPTLRVVEYLPFAVLAILGPSLKLLAWLRRRLDAVSVRGQYYGRRA